MNMNISNVCEMTLVMVQESIQVPHISVLYIYMVFMYMCMYEYKTAGFHLSVTTAPIGASPRNWKPFQKPALKAFDLEANAVVNLLPDPRTEGFKNSSLALKQGEAKCSMKPTSEVSAHYKGLLAGDL